MKIRIYTYLLRLFSICAISAVCLPTANTQTVYFSLAGNALIMITVDGGGCTEELIGIVPGNSAHAIAICGDNQLYITNTAGEVLLLDIATMQVTLIALLSPTNYITALTCSPDGLLYAGTNNSELLTIDPSNGTVTLLGVLPNVPQDLVFYNGALVMSTVSGLVLVDIANPSASTPLFNTPNFWGLSIGPNCGTLLGIAGGGSAVEIDMVDPSTTTLCPNLFYGSFDLTSPNEFNPPSNCVPSLDLDDDDSSGAIGADFFTDFYNCLTVGGLRIADEDVKVKPVSSVATMTIDLTGVLDAPNETLVLNNAPAGIAIAGSGTQSITLTNVGNASAGAFEQALRFIRYFNNAKPFTPGLRQVLVSFVNSDGLSSNTATAHIWAIELPELVVDLGPDIEICAGESIELDAGHPGSTYQWNNNQTTQTITVLHSGEYSVTVSSALGCPGIDTVLVTVFPNYTMNLDGTASICAGETAVLTISSTYLQPLDVLLSGSDSSPNMP